MNWKKRGKHDRQIFFLLYKTSESLNTNIGYCLSDLDCTTYVCTELLHMGGWRPKSGDNTYIICVCVCVKGRVEINRMPLKMRKSNIFVSRMGNTLPQWWKNKKGGGGAGGKGKEDTSRFIIDTRAEGCNVYVRWKRNGETRGEIEIDS